MRAKGHAIFDPPSAFVAQMFHQAENAGFQSIARRVLKQDLQLSRKRSFLDSHLHPRSIRQSAIRQVNQAVADNAFEFRLSLHHG
jgi:hypothetical protein